MFSFAWPWMVLLLPLPLLARALIPRKDADTQDAPEVAFPYIDRLRAVFPHREGAKRAGAAYFWLLGFVWLCLTGALMRPELVDRLTQVKNVGYDLMLAVDLSRSMDALDYSTDEERLSRLDVVKTVVGKFVAERQGDRIGLVLFGSNAYLHVPLTLDTLSVRKMLDNAAVGEAGESTAIGDALGMAVANLRDRPENSRIIILITDGADNSSTIPPLQAAKLAKQYGIRIYTIGIGTDGPVPILAPNGRMMHGIFSTDEGLLKTIAETTGGSFFHATDAEALQAIYARIDKQEKSEAEAKEYAIRTPLYRYPLGAAMAALFLLSLMPVYRKAYHGA